MIKYKSCEQMLCSWMEIKQQIHKKGVLLDSCTVFSFPKNESHRKEWIHRIQRDLTIIKNTVVCIKHFQENDIIRFRLRRTNTGKSVFSKYACFNNNNNVLLYL